jgi:hypothetical protein
MPGYPAQSRLVVELACIEAWAWLNARGLTVPEPGMNGQQGWRLLSRRARRFENEEEFSGFVAARQLAQGDPSLIDLREGLARLCAWRV